MSTLAVVEQILRETGVPMTVRQIVEHADGRLPTRSKTPDTVVARDLSMDIKRRGETSLFIRTAPGRYTLRELHAVTEIADEAAAHVSALAAEASAQAVAAGAAAEAVAHDGAAALARSVVEHTEAAAPTSLLSAALREERAGVLPARAPVALAEEQSGRR